MMGSSPKDLNLLPSPYPSTSNMERQIDINSINKRVLQLIRKLSNSIAELSYSIRELSNSITELFNWIKELSNLSYP